MTLSPQKMREVVFQLLYSLEEGQCDPSAAIAMLAEEISLGKSHLLKASERALAIQAHCREIDERIIHHSPSYTLERIHSVERNILRLGAYELIYDETLPPKIAITEAMRLTKKFSTEASAAFINAILDAIYKDAHGIMEEDHPRLAGS